MHLSSRGDCIEIYAIVDSIKITQWPSYSGTPYSAHDYLKDDCYGYDTVSARKKKGGRKRRRKKFAPKRAALSFRDKKL